MQDKKIFRSDTSSVPKLTISSDDVLAVRGWLAMIDDQIKVAKQVDDKERVKNLLSCRVLAEDLLAIYHEEMGDLFPY